MDLGLQNKVAVVTGASKGIGFEIAKSFLQEGCRLAICARNAESLQQAHSVLSEYGPVYSHVVDATSLSEMELFGKLVYEHYQSIDCWVNNVGGVGSRSASGYSLEDIAQVVSLCFSSAVFGCQIAGYYMKKNVEGGSIVNISSLAARCPTAGRSTLYGPLKAAVGHLSVTFAAELAAWNIRVNTVLPGFTQTDKVLESIPEQERNRVEQRTLIRRMAKPEEIARPVVFLCSKASSYITATSLEISGGREVVLNPEIAHEREKPAF
jgi:NAD(P)-dependent dehydrogenase (short-subunit alcohol dehydrogenase family)